MTSLFDSYRLGELTLPNRMVMAPMSRVRAAGGGLATPSMATYYAQRATAGLIVSEGVQPNKVGQSNPGTPGLHTDEQVAAWRPVTAAVHTNGGRIFAQIMHGGRVSHPDTTGMLPVGPSAVPAVGEVFTPTGPQPVPTPRALETAEVPEQARSYAEAARRAVDAGFDGVELHGANGYLISQFLSTNANLRTDRYGGPVAHRIRFAVEAVSATVEAVGADRTGIRLSPAGTFWGVEETDVLDLYTELLTELSRLGIAYVHIEATADEELLVALRRVWPGTLVMNPVLPMGPKQTGREDADHWLGLGADLISFGRGFIANPDLVERLRTGLPVAPVDESTYYQGGDAGYLTYPAYQHTV
ncbi:MULTISPECIES: alkene reductase [Streptomyces]|uniref:alkene reductase n=1 Tax=Streptomyces TaxID=1883 RepID=UPI0004C8ADBA|nr:MULTISPECIES: alkene reductase [Streptomyces]MBQ0948844.1 alkene reductase [Streptomyces sp. RK76]PSK53219.1 N-ethylmaleimide reductase [Streptomyces sp. 111WW2]WSB58956.1 alkene reductase [Streptomyces anthocyanicus]WSB65711.1 alkene reductase [Streptomyces anthocyanicus]WTC46454.1 alkene reductase [Streptomyces anthocyanicus]